LLFVLYMAEIGEVVASRSPLVLVCQQQLPDLCCMLSCGCISDLLAVS